MQPCCEAFANPHGHERAASQSVASEAAEFSAVSDISGHEDGQCPQVFALDTAPPGQFITLLAKLDHAAHLPVAGDLPRPFDLAEFPVPIELYHPSPPPRLYLRTLRLRI